MPLETGLEIYVNRNINDATGTSFPSAIGGVDLTINGSYTTDSNGVVLSGTDNTLKTSGDITFQTISMWFRYNSIVSPFNILDSLGDASASFTANTVATQARSSNLGQSDYQSGWLYGTMNQVRYDGTRDYLMSQQGTSVVEGSALSGGAGLRAVAFAAIVDFDYRPSANQYCAVDVNGDVTTSILGVRTSVTAIWSGTAYCVRYRESDDKFIIMIEGNSDQVCTLDGDTGTFSSIYSNTGITINPRALALNEGTVYFTASDSQIYSLNTSSNTNVPVQVTSSVVGTTKNLNYYRHKLYTYGTSNTLVEIHAPTGQQFNVASIPSHFNVYCIDFEGGYIFHPKTNDKYSRVTYDFTGSDGTSFTLTEGTNVISNTYINGESVTSLEDMIDYSFGDLTNVVFTLAAPTTSTLTLFGTSSDTASPDVTVESLSVYSVPLSSAEVSYIYNTYLVDNTVLPKIPELIYDGAVMYVNANITESYTSGAALMNDLSGSSVVLDFKSGATPAVLFDGGVDFTPGDNSLKLSQVLEVQTISIWYKKAINPSGNFIDLRDQNGGENANINQGSLSGNFFTNGTIYVDGVLTSSTDYINLADDTWYNVVFVGSYLSAATRLTLFADLSQNSTYENIFRSALFYDRALTAQEVLDNYTVALYFPEALLAPEPTFRYQFAPPSSDYVASLRVKDLDSLNDGDTISSWGTATAVSTPIYKNDTSFSFPYVTLDPGYFDLGQQTIQPSMGFTFMGLVYTTSASVVYPLVWSYAVAQDDGLRLYRTGSTGEDLVFRSQKAASVLASASDATTVNTWQVFTNRITDNGDSTITMEIFIDNVLQGSVTSASSNMSGIVNGLLEVGQSTAWSGSAVSPIYISDLFFYNRALSDTEVADMHTYFSTIGDPFDAPPLSVTPRAVSIAVSIGEISGATGYRLTSQQTGSSKIRVVRTDFTDLDQVVVNLKPETEYTLSLFSTTGSGYEIAGQSVVTTLSNSSDNYDVSEFGGGGNFDLSSLDNDSVGLISGFMNDLFTTGDTIEINVQGVPGSKKSKFVNRGATVDITNSDALIAPFSEDAGSGQTFDMTLSDTSTATVTYDETTNSVTIDSTTYSPGDSFVLDGKKVVVYDL